MNRFPNNGQDNGQRQPRRDRIPNGDAGRRSNLRPVQRLPKNRGIPAEKPRRTTTDPRMTGQRGGAPGTSPAPSKNGFKSFALVWVAILAVFLIVVIIISAIGRSDSPGTDETIPVGANVGDSTTAEAETEPIETYAVSYAEYTDDTASFSSSLNFANGILIDLDSNTVVASRGGDKRIYPASMTKIMTLIVAYENAKSLDDTFVMTAEITDPLYLANASVAGFLVGEEVTVRDLIYGLILPSGGDGALGLAYHIAGSEAAFAELMNEKAEELGLKNTHFTNCTGLHGEDHYSTCHEIALILEYAIKDDFMREVLSTYQYTTAPTAEHPEGIELTSTLFSRMYGNEPETAFVIGGKTGYTTEAKNCLATFATRCIVGESEESIYSRSPNYILVTAGSDEKFGPVFDAIDVYKTFSRPDQTGADGTSSDPSADGNTTGEAEVSPPDTADAAEGASETEDSTEKPGEDGDKVLVYTAAAPSES